MVQLAYAHMCVFNVYYVCQCILYTYVFYMHTHCGLWKIPIIVTACLTTNLLSTFYVLGSLYIFNSHNNPVKVIISLSWV